MAAEGSWQDYVQRKSFPRTASGKGSEKKAEGDSLNVRGGGYAPKADFEIRTSQGGGENAKGNASRKPERERRFRT